MGGEPEQLVGGVVAHSADVGGVVLILKSAQAHAVKRIGVNQAVWIAHRRRLAFVIERVRGVQIIVAVGSV